jgi:hypothetical protein
MLFQPRNTLSDIYSYSESFNVSHKPKTPPTYRSLPSVPPSIAWSRLNEHSVKDIRNSVGNVWENNTCSLENEEFKEDNMMINNNVINKYIKTTEFLEDYNYPLKYQNNLPLPSFCSACTWYSKYPYPYSNSFPFLKTSFPVGVNLQEYIKRNKKIQGKERRKNQKYISTLRRSCTPPSSHQPSSHTLKKNDGSPNTTSLYPRIPHSSSFVPPLLHHIQTSFPFVDINARLIHDYEVGNSYTQYLQGKNYEPSSRPKKTKKAEGNYDRLVGMGYYREGYDYIV